MLLSAVVGRQVQAQIEAVGLAGGESWSRAGLFPLGWLITAFGMRCAMQSSAKSSTP